MILYLCMISAGVVLFASLCRLTKTSHRTLVSVRLGIWMLATASFAALVAPFVWHWQPDLLHAALLVGLAWHQVATRQTWQHGVPEWFVKVSDAIEGH